MSDSKLNKKLHAAVRTGKQGLQTGRKGIGAGSRRAARKIRSMCKNGWRNMRIWQKAGLVLCVVFWIASVILGAVCNRTTGKLIDQQAAQRWSGEGNYAQVSCYLADGSGASEDTVKAMFTGLMLDLQTDAISLSDSQVDNGASLVNQCYCGMGSASISANNESVTVDAIGVGGDFFNFHPLELLDGYYFSDDDLMHDRVLIDDQTAWRLFGSPNVVGMQVQIGSTPHYIAGVFRQPDERFYKESGMGSYLVFMSYDSLCKYTEASSAGSEDEGGTTEQESPETTNMDAFAPLIPRTAAYMPSSEDALTRKERAPGTKSLGSDSGEDLGDAGDADDAGAGEDAGEEAPEEETPEEETEKAGEEEKEETGNDDPLGEKLENGSGVGSGAGKGGDKNEGAEEKEAVNTSRVTCYEVVMPEPVSGYAVRKVRSRLEQVPFPMEKATVVDNTHRYDTLRLAAMVAQPGVRSMQTAPIRYPYWENVALAWEDVLIPYAIMWMVLRYSPFVFLLVLVLWYATHKSWTVGGIIRDIQDRMYDRESEKIYGKKSGKALPLSGAAAIAADSEPGDAGNPPDADDADNDSDSLREGTEEEKKEEKEDPGGLTEGADEEQKEDSEEIPDDEQEEDSEEIPDDGQEEDSESAPNADPEEDSEIIPEEKEDAYDSDRSFSEADPAREKSDILKEEKGS